MNLKFVDAGFKYDNLYIFNNLNLTISSDKNYVILVKSGAGKTTFLRIIMKLEKLSTGYLYAEKDYTISPVFQDIRLIDDIKIIDNLCFIFKNIKDFSVDEVKYMMKYLLLDSSLLLKKPTELSGGQKRRIEIIRSLLVKRDFYVYDELTQGLDDIVRSKTLELINSKIKGGLIYSTHREDEYFMGDNIIEINNKTVEIRKRLNEI